MANPCVVFVGIDDIVRLGIVLWRRLVDPVDRSVACRFRFVIGSPRQLALCSPPCPTRRAIRLRGDDQSGGVLPGRDRLV